MRSVQVTAILVVVLLCIALTTGDVYYIAPSTASPCPSDLPTCFTLADFDVISTNMTLILLRGNHTLDSELLIVNSRKFVMLSAVASSWINCERTGFLTFVNVSDVEIRNLSFYGCGHITL